MTALSSALERNIPAPESALPEGYSCAGKTDRLIIHEMYRHHLGRLPSEREMTVVEEDYLAELAIGMTSCGDDYRILPGVKELLDLFENTGVVNGLGTGNLERAAECKLGHGGLFERFRFGGYGSDSPDRAALLRLAFERARDFIGENISMEDVLYFGDTPLDIAAVRRINGTIVAVATGPGGLTGLDSADLVVPALDSMEVYSYLVSEWGVMI